MGSRAECRLQASHCRPIIEDNCIDWWESMGIIQGICSSFYMLHLVWLQSSNSNCTPCASSSILGWVRYWFNYPPLVHIPPSISPPSRNTTEKDPGDPAITRLLGILNKGMYRTTHQSITWLERAISSRTICWTIVDRCLDCPMMRVVFTQYITLDRNPLKFHLTGVCVLKKVFLR